MVGLILCSRRAEEALRAARVNQNSWKTLEDTIKPCRINVDFWGCGKRRRFLVGILFFPLIFPAALLVSTHFLRSFSLPEFGKMQERTKKKKLL